MRIYCYAQIVVFVFLLMFDSIEMGRVIFKKRFIESTNVTVATGNIISAPKSCPPRQKLDSHQRCRKVF